MADLFQQAQAERRAGRLQQAVQLFQQILAAEPNHVQAHHELGTLLAQTNELQEAVSHLREANRLDPASAEILNNLGGVQEQLGQVEEAIASYRRAAELAPAQAIPHFNAGNLLFQSGRLDGALAMLRAAATLDPRLQEAWAALGQLHLENNEPAAALGPLRRALELRAGDDVSAARLGDALQRLLRFAEAIAFYEQALKQQSKNQQAWYGLGRALLELGRAAEAVAAFGKCLELNATDTRAIHDLGKAQFQLGCVERAMANLRKAANSGPPDVQQSALENLAIIVPGSPDDDDPSILETRRAWGRCLPTRHASRSTQRRPGPIRIGYASSFFHRPNWMKPVWALINQHDRERFDLHLFSDAPVSAVHGGYRPHARDHFHDMSGQSNERVADRIIEASIDVLVDLNAYSAPERLGIYSHRPAPVVVGWFNCYATTGLDCFDYLIGDESVVCANEEQHYCELIVRVPYSYLTFEVDYPVPNIAPLPMAQSGVVTIGCLASQYKLTDQVIAAWSRIMTLCPRARLLIRNGTLGNAPNQEHLRQRFAVHGIARDRVLLEGPAEHQEFLRTYDRIDFALDPFPYSGGTTTMEALWQGVPVVTFDAGRWASRTSISLLRAAGLERFIGNDLEDYIAICVRLATSNDTVSSLQNFRATIRDELRQSPVCDACGFARSLEEVYVQMVDS